MKFQAWRLVQFEILNTHDLTILSKHGITVYQFRYPVRP